MPDFFDPPQFYDPAEPDPAVCEWCEWRCPECGRCMCDDETGCRPCFGCGESQCRCECDGDADLDDDDTW